jgi:hypothetical protein
VIPIDVSIGRARERDAEDVVIEGEGALEHVAGPRVEHPFPRVDVDDRAAGPLKEVDRRAFVRAQFSARRHRLRSGIGPRRALAERSDGERRSGEHGRDAHDRVDHSSIGAVRVHGSGRRLRAVEHRAIEFGNRIDIDRTSAGTTDHRFRIRRWMLSHDKWIDLRYVYLFVK